MKVVLINSLYLVGALVGLLVGTYGLYIFIVLALVGSRLDFSDFHISSFYQIGVIAGLPLACAGFAYLAFVINLALGAKFRMSKYRSIGWGTALAGLMGVCVLAYYGFLMAQGL